MCSVAPYVITRRVMTTLIRRREHRLGGFLGAFRRQVIAGLQALACLRHAVTANFGVLITRTWAVIAWATAFPLIEGFVMPLVLIFIFFAPRRIVAYRLSKEIARTCSHSQAFRQFRSMLDGPYPF
jgi:hypothetical protein